MKCPHCLTTFHDNEYPIGLPDDQRGNWSISRYICPACRNNIFVFKLAYVWGGEKIVDKWMVYPKGATRSPVPEEVPAEFADDFKEACLVLSDSPKASAALSRRCLQNILREKAGIKKRDLADEIQDALDSNLFPSYVAESLDAVRNLGNFGAHPIKSKSTGEIVPVEEGEAEWTLDVLEMLFDFYFVQPAITARKREALNKKLADAGKPPMKGSSLTED